MTGPAGPASDVAAALASLIAARDIRACDLSRQAECTASHLSNIVHRKCRPSPALAARLDTALGGGGQVTAALARTPVARLRRSGLGPLRSPR